MATDGNSSDSKQQPVKPMSGVNSKVAEALSEYRDHIRHIDEIEDYIRQVEPTVLPLYAELKKKGIKNVQEMISALIQLEIDRGMENRDLITDLLRDEKAIVLLPLPPHIVEYIASAMKKGYVYNTEDKEPAHLKMIEKKMKPLTVDNLSDAIRQIKNVEAIVLDGQRVDEDLMIRPIVATLMESLLSKKVTKIFFHKIPHIPKGQKFTRFDLSDYQLDVREI